MNLGQIFNINKYMIDPSIYTGSLIKVFTDTQRSTDPLVSHKKSSSILPITSFKLMLETIALHWMFNTYISRATKSCLYLSDWPVYWATELLIHEVPLIHGFMNYLIHGFEEPLQGAIQRETIIIHNFIFLEWSHAELDLIEEFQQILNTTPKVD